MSTVLTSRKETRFALAALLDEIATFRAVYDHQTKDFQAGTPVGMIHSDGTLTRFPGYADEHHGYIVTLLWQRDDAGASENGLDDLSQDVRQKMLDNVVNALWNDIRFDEVRSQMGYVEIENTQYRIEEFRILVHVIGE